MYTVAYLVMMLRLEVHALWVNDIVLLQRVDDCPASLTGHHRYQSHSCDRIHTDLQMMHRLPLELLPQ